MLSDWRRGQRTPASYSRPTPTKNCSPCSIAGDTAVLVLRVHELLVRRPSIEAAAKIRETSDRQENPPLLVSDSAPVDYDAREFILYLFSKTCQEVGDEELRRHRRSAVTVLRIRFLQLMFKPLKWITKLWTENPSGPRETLRETADRRLKQIKFDHSYSYGWGGSLGARGVIGASFKQAVTISERQRSLPQIIDDFDSFLELAGTRYEMSIGIDELDKIESDEKAQRFLNDIKPLFGIGGCYWLISISESAISKFERRGLPFRDAFDSALGAVIHVEYLDIQSSMALIRRRMIGIPDPFLALCHCLSGGLPRDLLRMCRTLLAMVGEADGPNLIPLAKSLVRSELTSRARGLAAAAAKAGSGTDLVSFLDHLHDLEALSDSTISTDGLSETSEGNPL